MCCLEPRKTREHVAKVVWFAVPPNEDMRVQQDSHEVQKSSGSGASKSSVVEIAPL